MTTVGRWSPNKVRKRILDGTWVAADEALGGMVLMTPTSIASTGSGNSSSIGANGSVTFSSCATLSLNGVFTSTYDNYMVSIRFNGTSAGYHALRLRASGTDNSTASSYVYQGLQADGTTVTATRTTSAYADLLYIQATQRQGQTMYFFGPYLTQATACRTVTVNDYLSAHLWDFAWTHNQSVAYDGFTLYQRSGTQTIAGLVSVYGLGG